MDLTVFQNIHKLINQSDNILIIFKKDYSLDMVASALALALFLKKLDKKATIICEKNDFPPEYLSLPLIEEIKNNFSSLEKSLISIDISKTNIKELSYALEKNKLNIFITHEKGYFAPEEISNLSVIPFDLIFVLCAEDLNLLGESFENHKKIFQKPVINLDYHLENKKFGQINFIDMESTSCSEIIFKLISYFNKGYCLDEKIKTCLLNGMIGDNKNYFVPIKKDFNLKLLGKVLSKIKNDPNKKIYWATLNQEDFNSAQAGENDLILLIKGMLNYLHQSNLLILLYENEFNKIKIQALSPTREINILEKFKIFNPRGSFHSAEFIMENKNLEEAEELIIAEISKTF